MENFDLFKILFKFLTIASLFVCCGYCINTLEGKREQEEKISDDVLLEKIAIENSKILLDKVEIKYDKLICGQKGYHGHYNSVNCVVKNENENKLIITMCYYNYHGRKINFVGCSVQ